MTEYELLRIISFLERMRRPYDQLLPIAEPDQNWNMVLFLMRSHLRGQPVTMSSLAHAAEVPFASALRRIHRLIESGVLEKREKGPGAKTFYVVPSCRMVENFTEYARKIKTLLADTFGLTGGKNDDEDYYFGGSYLAGQIIPPLEIMESRQDAGQDLTFLLHDDNYFASMRDMWSDFRAKLSSRKNFTLLPLPQLREEVFANAGRSSSRFDVIAVNMPWLGEAVKRGVGQPLTPILEKSGINPLDFHPNIWATGTWDKIQYGVPIYCTVETLAIRRDLMEANKLPAPASFERVIEVGRHLHQPRRGLYGVVWNAARGMPIAHTFMFFMACCGSAVINLPISRLHLDYSQLSGEQLRPRVNSEAGQKTLDFMHRLLSISPPDILRIDWNRGLEYFMTGQAAMAYTWTMRAARFEYDIRSVVHRKVEYLAHPHGPGGASVSPIGGFLLMVPQSLPPERAKLAFEAIAWMASPPAMKEYVKNGFPVAPRFSVSADPEAAASTPIVRFVDRLAKKNKMQNWQRPPVPEYHAIEQILGEEIYAALIGEKSDRAALTEAEARIDKVMRDAGYY
jgi:multiple sugar transport system substrate-binding protein